MSETDRQITWRILLDQERIPLLPHWPLLLDPKRDECAICGCLANVHVPAANR